MKEQTIILPESSEAAKFATNISGWVDRHGHVWENDQHAERNARYSGCTHVACKDCGEPIIKFCIRCESCQDKRAAEQHELREKIIWDGKAPIYSAVADKFFNSWEEVADYTDGYAIPEESLRLVICEPVYLRLVDEDYWDDQLPEGKNQLPAEVADALEKLNEAIRRSEAISWWPGEKRVNLEKTEEEKTD